jgi:hypothetical protein
VFPWVSSVPTGYEIKSSEEISVDIVGIFIARRMRWAGHVARMEEVRGAYRILVGRPEGRRPLGRPRRR